MSRYLGYFSERQLQFAASSFWLAGDGKTEVEVTEVCLETCSPVSQFPDLKPVGVVTRYARPGRGKLHSKQQL